VGHWGKAGVRLTEDEIRARRQREGRDRLVREQADDEACRRWRAGGVVPEAITLALDARGLYGPEVDRACLVEEPAVDLWEAGKAYPTWEQLCALAALTGKPPGFFVRDGPSLDMRSTTLRFHVPPREIDEWKPPVLRCELAAIHAVTVGAPDGRPR
jgi:transcriptional regulator with XRE-family HTH domain